MQKPRMAGLGVGEAMTPTLWALLLAPIVGPLIGYLLFLPARAFARWLWKRLPDGKLRRTLLMRVGEDKATWPKLPPGP
jgi:hypothetical protein